MVLRTWREYSEDDEYSPQYAVEQIETDSNNVNTLYVLTFKGLYRSLDAGRSYHLMPLAPDKVFHIRTIAVDPIDSTLYAAVGGQALFASSDYGCSWRKLTLPSK
jgi:hypothetical protein